MSFRTDHDRQRKKQKQTKENNSQRATSTIDEQNIQITFQLSFLNATLGTLEVRTCLDTTLASEENRKHAVLVTSVHAQYSQLSLGSVNWAQSFARKKKTKTKTKPYDCLWIKCILAKQIEETFLNQAYHCCLAGRKCNY